MTPAITRAVSSWSCWRGWITSRSTSGTDAEQPVDLVEHRPVLAGHHRDDVEAGRGASARMTGASLIASGRVP